jgi:hypothetical protein
MHQHNYSLTEIESMLPWEREIYVSMLQQYLEEQELRARHNAADKRG